MKVGLAFDFLKEFVKLSLDQNGGINERHGAVIS
jgi:hypothetical protein